MKKVDIGALPDNFFEAVGKEWMLVTAGTEEKFNTMTASWGGIGYLWNRPVAFIFIRPERYTYEFAQRNDYITLSFLGENNRKIYAVCGSVSGRDTDKIKETGLIPVYTERGNVTFGQARLTLECKKLYAGMLERKDFIEKGIFEKWYSEEGVHKMYIAEIVDAYVREPQETEPSGNIQQDVP